MSSSSSTACPSCGRDDQVRGRPDVRAGDVELSCDRCHISWWRGSRGCATCGGQELTSRPQVMRRHSRGTQLSIVGWRDVVLCPRCDAEVTESVGTTDTPISENYVSAAIVDRNAPVPEAPPQDVPAQRPLRPSSLAHPARSEPARTQPAPAAPPPRPAPSPRPVAPTTVRQALQQSQEQLAFEGIVLDPTVVLLLGTRLGPTTRLDALERCGHDPASVAAWVRSTWGADDRSARARHTLTALAEHWLAHGWTTTDLAAALRPQEDT